MQNTKFARTHAKFCALLIIFVVLAGTLSLSPAISSLVNYVTIESNGQISIPTITAASGYWQDIQAAVDWVVAHGSIGNVFIPEGTFDFVNVGESWTDARVVIPAGVNVFGAPTERTSGLPYDGVGQNPNGQVVEWKTVLIMPWDMPGIWENRPIWFKFVGNGDFSKPSRFSDIKLVGYRNFDENSVALHFGIRTESVADFRVDHCYFRDIAGGAIDIYYRYETREFGINCGVIDHCYLVNTKGYVNYWVGDCTVIYGIHVDRNSKADLWEDDISKVLGQYTEYTVFVEDSYFEKWRHVVSSNGGGHYVFRHNTIQYDYGQSLDAHGWFLTRCDNPQHGAVDNPSVVWNGTQWTCGLCGEPLGGYYFKITYLGTRAMEIYNNMITDANWTETSRPNVIQYRGGAGIVFNNIAGGGTYGYLVALVNESGDRPEGAKVWCNDIWIWSNTLLEGLTLVNYDPDTIIEGGDFYLHAPHTFNYQPYPYPHPLTLE